VPRPIAWVSTRSKDGVDNLAPFSFFNCFGVDPPMVGFAPGYKSIEKTRKGLVRVPKDTMRNVEDTGEFVVNIVSRKLAEQMNATSAAFDSSESEFDKAGLTREPSRLVAPNAVADSLISFECKVIQLFQHGNNNLVIGEVLGIKLDPSVVNDRMHIQTDVLDAVGRMAGNWYATTRDRFELQRP
jgi:flavin reductase (DIM6/NTAB) family NADH-FMN oxidoreductase RutF